MNTKYSEIPQQFWTFEGFPRICKKKNGNYSKVILESFPFNYSWFFSICLFKKLKEICLSPGHDRVVRIKSRNLFIAKVRCCLGLYWSIRGCYLAAHSSIHASFILRRGLTRFQLLKGYLGLRIIECRNSSNILVWGPGAILKHQETSHSLLPNICKPGLDTPRYL